MVEMCANDEHLILDVLMDCMLQKYRHNIFVGGLLWHVVQNQVFNPSRFTRHYLVCRKIRDVLIYY